MHITGIQKAVAEALNTWVDDVAIDEIIKFLNERCGSAYEIVSTPETKYIVRHKRTHKEIKL